MGSIENHEDRADLSLLDVGVILAKHKKLALGMPAIGALIAIIVAVLIPNTYTATAQLLPPQQKDAAAATLLSSIVGVSSGTASSVSQALGLKNPNELYAGILRSQAIADRLISRFDLRGLYEVDTQVEARKELSKVTEIAAGADGLITISVEDQDPKRAADIANAYIEELDTLLQGLALTEAGQRRLFFEKQLASAQKKLTESELALRKEIETKGITGVDAQSRGLVLTAEQLRAQIAAKSIQLDAMRAYATEGNPEVLRLRQELESMKTELASLEGGRPTSRKDYPPTGLETLNRVREVKFLEFTVELLTKQYELARIDEAKDAVLLQVVSKATPPDYKSGPKRSLIVLLSTIVSLLVAILIALIREQFERMQADPLSAQQLARLQSYLRAERRT